MKINAKRLTGIFLILCMVFGGFAGMLTGLAPTAQALSATEVVLTDPLGTQVVLREDTEEQTYSWDANTATLTLKGWNGRRIESNGDLSLCLEGVNTLAVVDDTSASFTCGILCGSTQTPSHLRILAKENGSLNLSGDLTTPFRGIHADTSILGGALNLDLKTSADGSSYGIYGGLSLQNETQNATVDLAVETTSMGNARLYGIGNGDLYYNGTYAPTASISVVATGTETHRVTALSGLNVASPRAGLEITAKAYNNGSATHERYAIEELRGYDVGEGNTLHCVGSVRTSGNIGYYLTFNGHMQTTTPAEDAYYLKQLNGPGAYYPEYVMSDLSGDPLEEVVFAYSETLPPLTWIGQDLITVPGGYVGDYYSCDLMPGIKG